MMVDGYGNILAPLLPLLITRLDLSLAAAGTLTMLFQLSASVAQVGFGHLADRWNPRLLVMAGPVLSIVGAQSHRAGDHAADAGGDPGRRRPGRRGVSSAGGDPRAQARRRQPGSLDVGLHQRRHARLLLRSADVRAVRPALRHGVDAAARDPRARRHRVLPDARSAGSSCRRLAALGRARCCPTRSRSGCST